MFFYLDFLDILKELFRKIFDAVLAPVIESVAKILIQLVGSMITEMFSNFILRIFITLLKLVDFLEDIFNIFSGISPIRYQGGTTYFLDLFFKLEAVETAFLALTLIAAAAAFLFTMYATAKSISDTALEDKNPISTVLKNAMKSMLTFLMLPLLCLLMLRLATVFTIQINTTFEYANAGGTRRVSATMGDVLFIAAAGPAAKTEHAASEFSTGKKYADPENVKQNFNIGKINFVAAFLGPVLVILIMMGAVILFIRRVFEVLVLYLAAPFFAAAIPLDEGAMFGKWRDLFIAKVFSGFGSIFSMKIYLMVMPSLVSGEIVFSQSQAGNWCIQLFLVIGGAWAVYKGQHMILQLLNPDAAQAAEESTRGLLALGSMAARWTKGGAGMLAGKSGGKGGNGRMQGGGTSAGNAGAAGSGTMAGSEDTAGSRQQLYGETVRASGPGRDEQVYTGD